MPNLDLYALRDQLEKIDPLLSAQTAHLYGLHERGLCDWGTFKASYNRGKTALVAGVAPVDDIYLKIFGSVEGVFRECAQLTIDLREAVTLIPELVEEVKNESVWRRNRGSWHEAESFINKPPTQQVLDSFLEFYRASGFTEMHPTDNYPILAAG